MSLWRLIKCTRLGRMLLRVRAESWPYGSYLKEKRALLRAIAVFGEITLHSGSVCCHPLKDETLADQGRGALEAPQPSLLCSPA